MPSRYPHGDGLSPDFEQIATRPPTVAVFCNNPKLFGDNYKRYLDRKFREQVSGPSRGFIMRLWVITCLPDLSCVATRAICMVEY